MWAFAAEPLSRHRCHSRSRVFCLARASLSQHPQPASPDTAMVITIMRVRLKVIVFSLLAAAVTASAAPPAQAELINTAREVEIGRQVAKEIESRYGVVDNPVQQHQVEAIGQRIARVSDRPTLPWKFKILNTREVNAISLPGGIIYVTKGMMGFLQFEDELAFVLGHEVGHVSRRHHVHLLERTFYVSLVIQLLFGNQPRVAEVAEMANVLVTQGFNRELEFEADHFGVIYAHKAGFNVGLAVGLMERFRRAEGQDPSRFEVFFRTHPAMSDRIVRVKNQLRELGYRVAVGWQAA